MKKFFLLFSALFVVLLSATVLSAQVVVNANITTNTTWTKNNTYFLQNFVYVTNGAVLTIEPGTVIKGDKATKGTLIVTRGCKLIAQGTKDEPIVFTSNEAVPAPGDWGGIILLGYASTNKVTNGIDSLGVVEGGLDPVFGLYGGGDIFGGTKDDDNSGVISFVRIEYPGIAFSQGNEINGLTCGGVGNKTKIDHVQVSFCGDDAFEFFGGTVNCSHLISYRNLDDDFDTDNGFKGNIQFGLAVRDGNISDIGNASNGFESDNDADGTDMAPVTAATFSNMTIIGPSTFPTGNAFRRGAHIRRNSQMSLFNSVFLGAWPDAGILLDGAKCAANATAGSLEIKNTFIAGAATPVKDNDATFDGAAWFATSGWGNQTSADVNGFGLTDPYNLALPNALPTANSALLSGASFASARLSNFFFTKVNYAGAFGNYDWTCGWAKFENGSKPCQQEVISSNITTNTTWTKDREYLLEGFVYVTNCATLTIEPGTVIRGDKATKGALIVTRCAKIIAEGTEAEPIVFTSNQPSPAAGDWGGLIVLGYAGTNKVTNGITGLGLVEGGIDAVLGLYGGGDQASGAKDDDNSGVLRYVRIEYPGIAFSQGNEINGLTMGGVGSATTIDHIQVSYCGDDSYEWFGGTVNCKYLIAYRGLDDDFDTDNGFRGNIQYAMAVRDGNISDIGNASNGFESDNDADGTDNTPITAPTFSNVTLVAPETFPTGNAYRRGAHIRRNARNGIYNSVFLGAWPDAAILIDGAKCAANATAGTLEINNTFVAGAATPAKDNDATFDAAAWFTTAAFGNQTLAAVSDAKLNAPFNLDQPNLVTQPASPVIGAAAFTAPRIAGTFFDKVNYVGAFGGVNGVVNDWTCRWAKFAAGSSVCTVGANDLAAANASLNLFPSIANAYTNVNLKLAESADVRITIFGLSGVNYGTVVDQFATEGEHQFQINLNNLPTGFYFVQVQAGTASQTEKLIIARQ